MALVWFHRALSAGIFVYFNGPVDAYDYAREVLRNIGDPETNYKEWDITTYNLEGRNDVGSTKNLQVSVVSNDYVPPEGWGYWNNNLEFLWLTEEDAEKLIHNSDYEGHLYGSTNPEVIPEPEEEKSTIVSCLSRLFNVTRL